MIKLKYSKSCLKQPLSKRPKIGFQDQLSLNAGQKYCRMLPLDHSSVPLTTMKIQFVIQIVLSIFQWPLYIGLTIWDILFPINELKYLPLYFIWLRYIISSSIHLSNSNFWFILQLQHNLTVTCKYGLYLSSNM